MLGTARVREYIDTNRIRELHEAIAQASGQGMQTFDQALAALYQMKRVSFDEARLHCSNTADFDLLAQGIGSGRFESRSAVAEVA
ncbi:MAG: hypothetical protein HY270_14280 [Deltaproteobacteria bacterium]|nr:hypothetical protein [Deltaproteobacteria bacterium]